MSARPQLPLETAGPRLLPSPQLQRRPQAKGRKLAALMLLVLAGTEFVFRGPVRFATEGFAWNDFIPVFVQSRAWVAGANPYSVDELVRRWPRDAVQFDFLKRDLANGTLVAKRGLFTPYPPTSFVLVAPLTPLSWHAGHAVWLVLMGVCFAVLGQSLISLAGFNAGEPRKYILWAAMLALAPFHTAIATGNLVLPAFAAAMAGVWAAEKDRKTAAGILFAVALCLKPPLGLVFVAYYAVRCCWRVVLVSGGVMGALTVVAVARMNGTGWLESFVSNSRIMFGRGALNDFTTANPLHFHLVNLQMPLYSISGSVAASNALAWGIAALLIAAWLRLAVRHGSHDLLLELSALAVISLLPVYHRFVDAVLLALPVCWAIVAREERYKRARNLTLVFAAVFLAPGAAVLMAFADRHLVPSRVTTSWWWNAIVVPHQVWTIACIGVVMLLAMSISHNPGQSSRVGPSQRKAAG